MSRAAINNYLNNDALKMARIVIAIRKTYVTASTYKRLLIIRAEDRSYKTTKALCMQTAFVA